MNPPYFVHELSSDNKKCKNIQIFRVKGSQIAMQTHEKTDGQVNNDQSLSIDVAIQVVVIDLKLK